MEKTV